MKTISIRDLRQRWPEAEAALAVENEILVTRDSKPVAKLVRIVPQPDKRKRWNPDEHRKWVRKVYGGRLFPSLDDELAAAREERRLV